MKHETAILSMLCMAAVIGTSCTVESRVPQLTKSEAKLLLQSSTAFGRLAPMKGKGVTARPELLNVETVNTLTGDSMDHTAYATFRWRLVASDDAAHCCDKSEHVSDAEFFFVGGRWNLSRIEGAGVEQIIIWEDRPE